MDGNEPALSQLRRLFLQIGALWLIAARFAMPQPTLITLLRDAEGDRPPTAVEYLIKQLPTCSLLREELDGGVYGDGIERPYMRLMKQKGVERASVVLRGVANGNRMRDVEIVRRLYFRQFDGQNSQISEEATLKVIESSGLAATLDGIARNRALAAPQVRGHKRPFGENRLFSIVEFFSNPWLPEQKAIWVQSGKPKSLTEAVMDGDASGTRALLGSHRFPKKELDRVLLNAVLSRYDSSAVIKLLLAAGADVNARAPDGKTPLMNAVTSPCNIHPLLVNGADLNARDRWGRNALQVAREAKVTIAVRLLEEAVGRPNKH